jgi:hypothetical protein
VVFEPAHGIQDGVMFYGGGEHAASAGVGGTACPVEALDREVVGFGAAAGEDDLAGAGAEDLGDLLAGLLDDAAGTAAGVVER